MTRPTKLFAYRLGRDIGLDVDVIMDWSMQKLNEYKAFYITETDEFKEAYKEEQMTPEQKANQLMQLFLSGGA